MSPLFRDEVLQARRSQPLGSIRIGHNPRFTAVAAVALVLALAVVAYATWGEVTRKSRLGGILVPVEGTLNLSSAFTGRLVDVRVKEGQAVDAGQVLMTVGTDRTTAQGDTAALVAKSMEQRRATLVAERGLAELQTRQRLQALVDRGRSLDGEARQLESEQESVGRRVELAQKSLERYRELARSGFVAEVQVQQRQEELIDLTSRRNAVDRNLTGVRRDAQGLRAEQAALDATLRTQLAQLDRGIAALEQESTENTARRELTLVAPRAGTVSAIVAKEGQIVQAGQTLAALVPVAPGGGASPLEAHLFAPSRAMGFVAEGQEVWLRYAAYPYQKFGMARGSVESVSRTPIGPQDLPVGQGQALLATAQANEPLYRVTVKLESQQIRTYGETQALRAGMALEADAVQERRKVWEWVLEPVLAASGLAKALSPAAPAAPAAGARAP